MVGTLCIYLSFYKLLLCTRLYGRSICIGLRVGVACGVAASIELVSNNIAKFSCYISQCIMKLQRIVLHLEIDIILIIERHYFLYIK